VAELVLGGEGRWAELPLPSIEEVLARAPAARARIEARWLARYRALGYDGVSPWGFEDPRSCAILPLYLAIFPGARVLHIVRSADDVAASLARKHKRGVDTLRDADHWRRLARAGRDGARPRRPTPVGIHRRLLRRRCRPRLLRSRRRARDGGARIPTLVGSVLQPKIARQSDADAARMTAATCRSSLFVSLGICAALALVIRPLVLGLERD